MFFHLYFYADQLFSSLWLILVLMIFVVFAFKCTALT